MESLNPNLETLYLNQKQKIKDNFLKMQEFIQSKKNYQKCEISSAKINIDVINDSNKWLYTLFNTYNNSKNIECPKISNNEWNNVSLQQQNIEARNLIFQSQQINYEIVNNNLKANVTLKGSSSFWIFLHCKELFDEETIIIVFTKDEKPKKYFVSSGTFVKNEKNDNFEFVIFQKLQLIKEETNKNKNDKNDKYENDDACNIQINIFDNGLENIKVISKVNEGKYENILNCKFAVPVNMGINNNLNNLTKSRIGYKIMFAGSGDSCKVTQFISDLSYKKEFQYVENNRKRNNDGCDCKLY